MKTKLFRLVLLLCIGFAHNAHAQLSAAIRLGGTAGLTDTDIAKGSAFLPFARYYGGISISRANAKNHGVQFQINYISRAFQRQLIFLNSDNEYKSYHYNTFIDALELKSAYMYKVRTQLNFTCGLFYSYVLNERFEDVVNYKPINDPTYTLPTMNKSDYGVSIGATYDWFEKWQLDIGITYGLQPLYKNPEPFDNIKLRTITFGINRKIMFKK